MFTYILSAVFCIETVIGYILLKSLRDANHVLFAKFYKLESVANHAAEDIVATKNVQKLILKELKVRAVHTPATAPHLTLIPTADPQPYVSSLISRAKKVRIKKK